MRPAPMLKTVFPFLNWFPLSGDRLRGDLIAGITVALVLVPQSMAYAQLAGLPVVYGLYASFMPVIIASLWGSLPQLHTGPVAMLSLMSAAAVLPLAALGSEDFIVLSVMLALMVGVLRLVLGLLRMGILVNFLSSPVIVGFTNAAALIIGLSQLSKILNVPFPRTDNFVLDLWTVIVQLPQTHLPTLLFALATFVIIIGARRVIPKIPGVLLAVVLLTLLSWWIGFERNQSVPLDAIQDQEARTLAAGFASTARAIDSLGTTTARINQDMRDLISADDADRFAEVALLEADLRVLTREMNQRKLANNERQVALHNLRFEHVLTEDGRDLFYRHGAVPADVEADGHTWRISKVDGDQIKMMGGGAVVGAIPAGLPSFQVPEMRMDFFWTLFPSALVMALIGFMEATSISKAIAAQTRERVDTSKELVGQGLANIVGSFFSSYTVSGSFSRSAVAAKNGAKTGLFAIISAIAVMLVLLFLTPLLYHLPQAVLAVIVMMAVFGLINIRSLVRAWKIERQEALVGLITFIATLAMAPQLANGILLGAGLAIVLFLVRTMQPRTDILGRRPDGSLAGVSTNEVEPLGNRFIVVRFDGSLNFVNASRFEDVLLEARAKNPQARAVLIDGSGINDIDVTGEERLRDVIETFRDNGVELYFSSLKSQVYETLRRGKLFNLLDETHFMRTKRTAIDFMKETFDTGEAPRPAPPAVGPSTPVLG
ncbi:sodium-independent anion transporter [Lamprobacter modestohalophilus]|uniref:Sodium-independent anion transporter n=1 Tax=Lamprobacter modestohalophilus TaxID=1064514 RepID=A0A9X0W6R1_9GAMM|nr:SulP family inorganic anion transporter [Lamprobacter modestohalophilus]MBK1617298.1 sodium-independent anion transporter [Lamprobacter modestohalophilus]